ncbi:MAG: MazG nucleotide pyrophosphohydrolase domain-containing protein [Isosphaeraceae bacterium]
MSALASEWTVSRLQSEMERLFGAKDRARGEAGTFMWLAEEFGELASALRGGTDDELALEMADVLAWLATLANIRGIDLNQALERKYGRGCPECLAAPCTCDPADKP